MDGVGRTVADRLGAARRRALVGRRDELDRVRELLTRPPAERPSVLHVHGPGGVGKTALLQACEHLADDLDLGCLRVDAADVAPTVPGFVDALRRSAGADAARLHTARGIRRQPTGFGCDDLCRSITAAGGSGGR